MLEKVKRTIEKFQLLSSHERVIVGFSGGIDSVCLLHVLHCLTEYQLKLWAVYVNYALRPAENLREKELLKEVGERWGIRTREFEVNLPEQLKQKPQSLQLLAREERYRIFKNFLEEIKADKVALAHHRDDQVETILYRIIRGTGLDGLAGMPAVRDRIFIRPFLEVSRQEIREYVTGRQLRWVEDSSNQKLVYRRNKIRHQLIPQLEAEFNPRLKNALLRLGKLAGEQQRFMEEIVAGRAEEIIAVEPERIGILLQSFVESHPFLQYHLLKRVFRDILPNQLEMVSLDRLREKIVRENYDFKKTQVFKTVTVYRERERIFFEKYLPVLSKGETFRVDAPGETYLPTLGFSIRIARRTPPGDWNQIDDNEVYIDYKEILLPLSIRFWLPGDFFWPLGAPGRQKLHDFFINKKIPRRARKKIPLLITADHQIIWVIGYRLDERFKVKSMESEVWHISIKHP